MNFKFNGAIMDNVRIFFINNITTLLLDITTTYTDEYINSVYVKIFKQFESESREYINGCIEDTNYPYTIPKSGTLREFLYNLINGPDGEIPYTNLDRVEQEYLIWLLCVIMYCWENRQSYMFFGYSLKRGTYKLEDDEPVVCFKDALTDESFEEMIENYKTIIGMM